MTKIAMDGSKVGKVGGVARQQNLKRIAMNGSRVGKIERKQNLKNAVMNGPRRRKFWQENGKHKLKDNAMDKVESGTLEYFRVDEKGAVAKCRITPVDAKWIDTNEAFEGEPLQIRSRMCVREAKSDDRTKLHAETPPLEALKKGVEEPWTVERVIKFADLLGYREITLKEFRKATNRITELLLSNYMIFEGHPNEIQKEWRHYVDKVEKGLDDALKEAVKQQDGAAASVQDQCGAGRYEDGLQAANESVEGIDRIRKEDDECALNQSEGHRPWVIEEHQNIEQEVALEGARNRVPTRSQHVDVIVKDFGLERGNSARTPAFDVIEEEESEPLSQDQHYRYRWQVTRCLLLSQDRAGTTFIVNELCQKMSNPNTKKNIDEFGATIRCQGCNALKDNARAQARSERCRMRMEERLRNTPEGAERLDRRSEVINEALAEEIRRGEQREKRSDRTIVEAQETGSAAASATTAATTTATRPAAGPARENPIEPDANPRRRMLMKSAPLTAGSSREQGQERSIPDDESRMQVEDAPKTDTGESAASPAAAPTNIKRRIDMKSESAAVTTQEAILSIAVNNRMSADAAKAGLMKKSMYGSRHVASNWKSDWQDHVQHWGFPLGLIPKNLFHHKEDRVSGLAHKCHIESRALGDESPVVQWLVEHAGCILSRCQKGRDGKRCPAWRRGVDKPSHHRIKEQTEPQTSAGFGLENGTTAQSATLGTQMVCSEPEKFGDWSLKTDGTKKSSTVRLECRGE